MRHGLNLNNKGRRIFIAAPFENHLSERGTRHPNLADYLNSKGEKIIYLTTNFSHAYKCYFNSDQIKSEIKNRPYVVKFLNIFAYSKNVSINRVISNFIVSIKLFFYLLFLLRKGDIVIFPSRPVEWVAACIWAAKLKRSESVMDIRDVWPDALPIRNKVKKSVFTLYCNFWLFLSIPLVDRCVHVAPNFLNWLHRYSSKQTSVFIPLGFDDTRWRDISYKKSKAISNVDSFRLIFVGLQQLQLDVMPVLEALRNRPRVSLSLVGDSGTGEGYHRIIEYIKLNNLKNVKVIGRTDPEKVVELFHDHDIALVPMITDSIPNKVSDAIASYSPLLVLGENDSSKIVEERGIGWSVPFDSLLIGDFLDNLSKDSIELKQKNLILERDKWRRSNLFEVFYKVIIG